MADKKIKLTEKEKEAIVEGATQLQQQILEAPLEEEKLVAKCDDTWDSFNRARMFTERKWYLYYQFFRGNQWIDINRLTGELFVPPAPSWRVRLVINKTWVIIRNIAANITDKRPSWDVLPSSDSPEDIETAKLIGKVIEYLYDKLKVQDKIEELVYYMLIFGVAYLKTIWDGKEIALEIIDPFAIWFDPASKNPQDATAVIHGTWRDLEYIKKHYPEKGDLVKAETAATKNLSMMQDRILMDIVGYPLQAIQPTATQAEKEKKFSRDGAFLKEGYFRKQDGSWEIITWANQQFLKRRDHPYKHARNPITKFVANRVPGEWLGISEIENLIPLQKELNKGRSQVVEHKNLMSRGKWLVPKNAGVANSAFTSEPGEVIFYNPGAKPEQADLKPLPEYVFEMLQWVERGMEDISGIHDVSMGRIPTGAKSGKAIEALRESDEVAIRPKERNLEIGLEEVGYQMVGLMQQYYTEEKLIKMTEHNKIKYFKFSGSQIKEGYDVRVNMGTAFAYTRLGKREELRELFQIGAIDRQTLLEHYEFGNVDEIMSRAAEGTMTEKLRREKEELDAEEENNTMTIGGEEVVMQSDDHEIHLRIHEEYIATHREEIEKAPDEVLKAFEDHIATHTEMLAQAQLPPTGQPGAGGMKTAGAPTAGGVVPTGVPEGGGGAPPPA